MYVYRYKYVCIYVYIYLWGGERKPARVFSVKPARKMISLWQSSKQLHLLHEATLYTTHPFTPDTFYTRRLLHQTPFTSTDFYTTPFIPNFHTCLILLHQPAFTPDTFYTKHPLHLPTFTPHLSHQTPFTSSTFYTTPGRQTKVDSSLWPQRTVPKLPSGTNGCQTLKTATLNTFYFCQKRPLCQPPPSPTPPPYSHFVRKVKLRLAYRLAFVIIMYRF